MPDSEPEGLQQHPLVDALLPDPLQASPNARRIVGYLGRSASSGVWRLYLSPNLDRYAEIPAADILHAQQLPGDEGTAVWVRRGVRLQYVAVQTRQVEADYLSGPIAASAAQAPAAPHATAILQGICLEKSAFTPYCTQGCTHGGGGIGPCGGGPTDYCPTLSDCL